MTQHDEELSPHEQLVVALELSNRVLLQMPVTDIVLDQILDNEKALALLSSHTLVPNEPTEEMVNAVDKVERWGDGSFKFGCRPAYKAMVQTAKGEKL